MVKKISYNLIRIFRSMGKDCFLQDFSLKAIFSAVRLGGFTFALLLSRGMRRVSLLLLAFILGGCLEEVVEDLPSFGEVNLSTDWEGVSKIPGGIVVYFYPQNDLSDGAGAVADAQPIVEHLSNKGAKIPLVMASYDAFLYNDYSENLRFRNMDKQETAEVYLKSETKAPFSKLNSNVEYISELEDFYLCALGTFTLSEEFPNHLIHAKPELKTITLEVEIPVDGIHNVAHARGNMSAIGRALNLSTGKTDVNNVANIVFDFTITTTGISAKIKCFGIPKSQDTKLSADEGLKNILEVAFILKDGSSIADEFKFDLTKDITYQVAEKGGFIPYSGIKPLINNVIIENDGGFQIEVGGWDDVAEDLNVNE